jgi:hypothetical protein
MARIVLAASALLLTVVALAAPAPTPPPSEPLTDAETAGLKQLHRNAVEIFIDRPGFGVRRLVLPLDDVIGNPKSKKDTPDVEKGPQDGTPVRGKEADKAVKKLKETHFSVQDQLEQWGLGAIPTEDKKEQWKLRKLQLVGLVKHKDPVVYQAEKVPDMKEMKEVPTRELDAFEKTALEALRGGDNLKAEKRAKEIRVLAPIYAGARCVTCHEKKGELLGAFSYQLERVPLDPEKEKNTKGPRLP